MSTPTTKLPFATDIAVGLLTEVRDSIRENTAVLRELLQMRKSRDRAPNSDDAVASDSDLDSQYGDPEIKMTKMPRDWSGPNMKGRKFSQCPPEFLDALASFFDWAAEKAERDNELYNGKPVAPYKRKDASRARGWSARLRGGWTPPQGAAEEKPAGWQADRGGW